MLERASCFQAPVRARPAGEQDKVMFGKWEGVAFCPSFSLCFPLVLPQLPCSCSLGYWAGKTPGSSMAEFSWGISEICRKVALMDW